MEFIIGANPNNKENKLKMTVVLTKNANILRKSSNTIETKDDNTYQDFILSSNKKNGKMIFIYVTVVIMKMMMI